MDASTNIYLCPYCNDSEYSAPSKVLLLNHIRLVYSNDPGFSIHCSFPRCSRTFANFRTYQNHFLVHPRQRSNEDLWIREDESSVARISVEEPPKIAVSMSNNDETVTTLCNTTEDMQLFAAKWILKTRETRNLTKSYARNY